MINENIKINMSTNIMNSQEFKIKSSPQAFKILSDNIYQDKIMAIIRELSTNALDAHKAAGNNEKFIVHAPTNLEPVFYVKDFGIGLSQEQIFSLYTTFFDSNKNTSNDFIGTFGLGSKSPLSYIESFSVISNYNKKQSVYVVFINENGVPQVSLISEQKTTEKNGLNIQIPVKTEDIQKFKDKIYNFFKFWKEENRPKIIGQEIEFIKYDIKYENENLSVINSKKANYYDKGYYVNMGNIIYPISFTDVKNNNNYKAPIFNGNDIVIYNLKIGDVEINPGRETLSYSNKTIEALINTINNTNTNYIDFLCSKIDSVRTANEVLFFVDNSLNIKLDDFVEKCKNNKYYDYMNKIIYSNIPYHEKPTVNILSYVNRYSRIKIFKSNDIFNVSYFHNKIVNDNYKIVIMKEIDEDTTKKNIRKIKKIINQYSFNLFIINDKHNEEIKTFFKCYNESFYNYEKLIDEFPIEKIKRERNVNSVKREKFEVINVNSYNFNNTNIYEPIDIKKIKKNSYIYIVVRKILKYSTRYYTNDLENYNNSISYEEIVFNFFEKSFLVLDEKQYKYMLKKGYKFKFAGEYCNEMKKLLFNTKEREKYFNIEYYMFASTISNYRLSKFSNIFSKQTNKKIEDILKYYNSNERKLIDWWGSVEKTNNNNNSEFYNFFYAIKDMDISNATSLKIIKSSAKEFGI